MDENVLISNANSTGATSNAQDGRDDMHTPPVVKPKLPPAFAQILHSEEALAHGETVLLTSKKIDDRVSLIAAKINGYYRPDLGAICDEAVIVLAALNGSFMFVSDLIRKLHFPIELSCIRAKSYGDKMKSSGKVDLMFLDVTNVKGRDVLIVDDIYDSGLTMAAIVDLVKAIEAKTLKTCAFLVKGKPQVHFYGATIPDECFVYGYGLDIEGRKLNLPHLFGIRR